MMLIFGPFSCADLRWSLLTAVAGSGGWLLDTHDRPEYTEQRPKLTNDLHDGPLYIQNKPVDMMSSIYACLSLAAATLPACVTVQ